MPVPDDKSVRAIAPNTFDSWEISKCQANESQPNHKKATPKIKHLHSSSNAESANP
ncbi:MAG: hypothetical protein JGK24_10610 [Microcoleus sp. PH2017_29_MFU_D_A]|uniref:hypothetical protein n=1 Tax=unclassified Microcoleus TaxID=2642155 RepID=UPI001DF7F319|nr:MULTISPECIES: hypothetical protein [unclassified Microcoleus]MCC3453830.1 hypothetical protein [Microcoleus sp. PH2017_08_TRC_O_A]MCC3508004.1 hypothetical protein [Microcoleus sp. PH2017_17_BER_D_A]MCC3603680.1 hypothetical protein [Microcoleus sp. PH2017_29_MFU_D_A]MCC3634729.1 hypothetical protein [Microcoleus sp. PH2017_37_MFU_D_B]